MKKALLKDSIKEIVKTYKRFLSIMLMSLLGVGFFAGIRATGPDMRQTIDNYLKENNVYDIELVSTLGLTDDDIELLKTNQYVSDIIGTYSTDVLVDASNNNQPVAKLLAMEDINKVRLVEGELPQNDNECVVEKAFLSATGSKVGDTIEINDDDDVVKNDSLKITGVVESPLYISSERGTSSLGTGKVNYYMYIKRENFNMDVYTNIYIKVKDSQNYIYGSDEYTELVDTALSSIEGYEEEINTRRYDSLISEANEKIEEAQQELDDEYNENNKKLEDAQAEIDDYRQQIADGRQELEQTRTDTYNTFLEYETQIADGKTKIEEAKNTLESQKVTAQENIDAASSAKATLQENIDQIDLNLEILIDKYNEVYETLENPIGLTEEDIEYLKGVKL